jgi:hypothetical protein
MFGMGDRFNIKRIIEIKIDPKTRFLRIEVPK